MLRQQTKEEKQLWKAFAGTSLEQETLPTSDIAEEIQLVERILRREYRNVVQLRYPIILVCLMCMMFIGLTSARSSQEYFAYAILWTPIMVLMAYMVTMNMTLSPRWKNGVFKLRELSKNAPAEASISSLLYVVWRDRYVIHLNRDVPMAELYHRLAEILIQRTEFVPSDREHRFLQDIVLNSRRYPDSLRLAALLTLSDQPARLSDTFLAKLKKRQPKEENEGIVAVTRDILART